MFGLEGSGFIISIGLTFLLCGIIMYYCNSEITRLNLEISKQNNVIVDLLERFKSNVSITNMNPVANPTAIQSAHDQHMLGIHQNTELIPVSDCDSEEEDDSDDDSDDDSSDSDNETNAENNAVPNGDIVATADVATVDVATADVATEETVKVIDLEATTNSPEHLVIEEIPPDENNKTIELIDSSSNESDSDESEVSTDYKQYKVNELKDILVNDRNVEPKTLKNLKKEELIQLLQKK